MSKVNLDDMLERAQKKQESIRGYIVTYKWYGWLELRHIKPNKAFKDKHVYYYIKTPKQFHVEDIDNVPKTWYNYVRKYIETNNIQTTSQECAWDWCHIMNNWLAENGVSWIVMWAVFKDGKVKPYECWRCKYN